jgi:hypothetical protein
MNVTESLIVMRVQKESPASCERYLPMCNWSASYNCTCQTSSTNSIFCVINLWTYFQASPFTMAWTHMHKRDQLLKKSAEYVMKCPTIQNIDLEEWFPIVKQNEPKWMGKIFWHRANLKVQYQTQNPRFTSFKKQSFLCRISLNNYQLSGEIIFRSSGGAQEKGKRGWNSVWWKI